VVADAMGRPLRGAGVAHRYAVPSWQVALCWQFVQVACAAGGLVLACGGATRDTDEQTTAGASAGGTSSAGASTIANAGAPGLAGLGGSVPSGGNGTAGALLLEPGPMCFTPDELPAAWYGDNAAGAGSRACPIGEPSTFGIGYCYFALRDLVPTSPPPGHEAECCYWLSIFHCR
jgi:hypothetical protein